jgi:hypothetical protein
MGIYLQSAGERTMKMQSASNLVSRGGLRVEGGRVYSVGRQSQKLPANDPARKSSGVNVL